MATEILKNSSGDTPPHDSPEMIALLQKLSLDERAKRFFDLWNFARDMQWTGIKMRNPKMTDAEVTQEFKRIMFEFYEKQNNNHE